MSSVNNRIVTTFQANAGNAVAVMNQMAGGMTNIGRAATQTQRQTGLMNQQMRAFGTTMRYAFAGSVIFGATRMLSTLRETQRQLGLIAVLGGFDKMGQSADKAQGSINDLYRATQLGAIDSLTPVNELNDGIINLYSTVQGLKPDQAVAMTTAISKGAQIAQVSVEDMTKTVAGMTTAFGRPQNLAEFQKFMGGFFTLTSQAPGGIAAGPQFVQQLPVLAATARLANITPETMLGTYLTGLRTAGTPATVGRGQQFMWQSLAAPASEEARKALAQAGITPEATQQKGGAWALGRLIAHAQGLGVSGVREADKVKFSDDQLNALENVPPEAIGGTLGISGKGAEFISTAMGRIHAVRQVIAIMAQGDQAGGDIDLMMKNMHDSGVAAKLVQDQFDKFAAQNPLQALAVSLDTTRRAITSAAEPFIVPVVKQLSRVSRGLAEAQEAHPDRTRHRLQAAGGILGAAGLIRLLRGGSLFGRRGGNLLGGIGQGFVTERAIADIAAGGGQRGHTPQLPLYVTVVGELFGNPGGGPVGFDTGLGPHGPKNITKVGRLARLGKKLGIYGALAAGTVVAGKELGERLVGDPDHPDWLNRQINTGLDLLTAPFSGGNTGQDPNKTRARQLAAMGQLQGVQRGSRIENVVGYRKRQVEGRAVMTLNLNLRKPDGTIERRRIHVPMELWSKGTVPSSRGKAGGG